MSACTFFGHHDCPSSIKPKLREVLIDLIENHAVDMFYVGQQGVYDAIVCILRRSAATGAVTGGHLAAQRPPVIRWSI